MKEAYDHVWAEHFKLPVDERPGGEPEIRRCLKQVCLEGEWYEAYDLVEFLMNSEHHGNRDRLRSNVERILAEECAGFRLINNQFVEITDETEIAAIEEVLDATSADPFTSTRMHIQTALALLSDRENPDYRNSIKESISAVEAVAQVVSGDPQAELGKALKAIEARAPLHGALRSAFQQLYGYTSDSNGIRHALTEAPTVDAADAKFMLVACAAFVVYVIQKASDE